MDEARFKELFLDTKRWITRARQLKLAGDYFIEAILSSTDHVIVDREGFRTQSPEFLQNMEKLSAFSDARALLYGLAIENACKARQIHEGNIEVCDGKAKGIRTDHDLLEMVKQAGYSPTTDELEFLSLLTYQTQVLAKYPIAKDLKKQSSFTGRVVGAMPQERQMTENIIISVLNDQDIIDLFKQNYG